MVLAFDLSAETDALPADPLLDELLQAGEGPTADEQDVRGIDSEELLRRVLATALWRHAGLSTLEDLEQSLLNAFTGHVTGDRRVVGLARDLVDFVDVDDARLGLLDVEVRRLDELEQDVLHVLAHVAGLGEGGRVGDGERHVEDARQSLRQ